MNTSKIGKHFKVERERQPVTLAGYINDSALVADGSVMLLLTAAETVRAFARRDWWPSLPGGEGQAYQYSIDPDDTLPKEERIIVEDEFQFDNKVVVRWNEWTDIHGLEPIAFTSWIQMLSDDLTVHLLKRGAEYLYLDTEKVALVTDYPMKLRWYCRAPDGDESPSFLIAADGANPIAVFGALNPNVLEALRPPDNDNLAQAVGDFLRDPTAAEAPATIGLERETEAA